MIYSLLLEGLVWSSRINKIFQKVFLKCCKAIFADFLLSNSLNDVDINLDNRFNCVITTAGEINEGSRFQDEI